MKCQWKSRDSSEHTDMDTATDTATDTDTDTEARLTPSGKGATGRDEAERKGSRAG